MTDIIVVCPHCQEPLLIEKINCGIFRHGVMKTTGKHINPHSSKKTCTKLLKQDLIYGCGKPFQIIINNDLYKVISCEYI